MVGRAAPPAGAYDPAVTDQKPPRTAGDERSTLLSLLQYQRESFVRKVTDLGEDDARRSPVASGTTLLWLTRHLARAEIVWVLDRFAGHAITVPDDTVADDDTLADAIAAYRDTWRRVDAVVGAASLDDRCRNPDRGDPADLRWVLAHLLEETARHAGHADILRELVDGRTGR